MRLLKREKDALVELAESGDYESAGEFVEALAKRLDEMRGQRTHIYACAIVAGTPLAVGPLATRNQAEKALAKLGAVDRGWAVPGWTAEGWDVHLEQVDAPPPPAKTEQWKGGEFWKRVSEIREGSRSAITGRTKQDIEIRGLVV